MEDNGDFEIVDQKMATMAVSPPETSVQKSMITNIPPPSALPSFITSPLPPSSSASSLSPPLPPPSIPLYSTPSVIPPSSSSAKHVNPPTSSISSMPQQASPQVQPPTPQKSTPVTIQPLPPSSSSQDTQGIPSVTSLSETPAAISDSKDSESIRSLNDGWIGWIRGTVQSVGHKVAEKAKTSMDSMITTLDPQMKDFINSGGDIDVIVASDKEVKVNPIREAFQKTFGKATVSGFASQSSGVAVQPVGFESALKSAEDRINTLRSSGKIHPQHPVVAIENFVVEFMPETWVEMGLLLLDDPWHDIILQMYTQPTPVPYDFIQEAKKNTPDDYLMKDSGFALTIGQIAANKLQVHHTMWQENLTGVSRRETILLAARTLTELYRCQLPSNII